jgi:hypothetical protein
VLIGTVWALVMIAAYGLQKAQPRISKWLEDRKRCPHGIRGGLTLGSCKPCLEAEARASDERDRKASELANQERIRRDAQELRKSEKARLARSIVPSLAQLRQLSPQGFEDEIASMFNGLATPLNRRPTPMMVAETQFFKWMARNMFSNVSDTTKAIRPGARTSKTFTL